MLGEARDCLAQLRYAEMFGCQRVIETFSRLIAVMLRLVRALLRYPDVSGLFGAEFGQLCV